MLFSPKFLLGASIITILFLFLEPALAHHPFEGRVPSNFFEGLLSGLGHPIIGLDHFAFVVAIGLLAVLLPKKGFIIPIVFALATGLGTLIHLQSINLPIPELVIAFSVFMMGILLGLGRKVNFVFALLESAIAGIFHGYAYGEAIIGAESTPLFGYLLGFIGIQLVISAIAFKLGSLGVNKIKNTPNLNLRFAGFLIGGIGFTFLSNIFLG